MTIDIVIVIMIVMLIMFVKHIYNYNLDSFNISYVDTWRLELRDENGSLPFPTFLPNGQITSTDVANENFIVKSVSIYKPDEKRYNTWFPPIPGVQTYQDVSTPLPGSLINWPNGKQADPTVTSFLNYF